MERTISDKREPARLPCLLLLAMFFLAGAVLGQVLARRIPEETGAELGRYLTDLLGLEGGGEHVSHHRVMVTLALYFRYPLLALLLGSTALGVVLLPCVTAAYGFFLSFSVCCFTASFGPAGVLLALAVFGLRSALTLPCYLFLAVPAWGTSAALASLSLGKGRRTIAPDRDWYLRAAGCGAVLLAGAALDLLLSPWLLEMALAGIFP